MNKIFFRKPSRQAASPAARNSRPLADAELAGIVGGAAAGRIQLSGSLPPGVAIRLPFPSGLQQLPLGAHDADSVPWAALEPAVKKIDSAGWRIPAA